MPYTPHHSPRLIAHFANTPWQGNNPMEAIFLFVGLDANFEASIDETLPLSRRHILSAEVFDYLDNCRDWLDRVEVHHPFRLPSFDGDGIKYHGTIAEIGFTSRNASLVSFVELLRMPTTGRSNLKLADLSLDYLSDLNNIFVNGEAQYIFVSGKVTKLMRQSNRFPHLKRNPLPIDGDLKVLRNENGKIIYEMYHPSCWGWQQAKLNRQIAQIREIVQNYIGVL